MDPVLKLTTNLDTPDYHAISVCDEWSIVANISQGAKNNGGKSICLKVLIRDSKELFSEDETLFTMTAYHDVQTTYT